MSQLISVVVPVYEGVTQLDFTGPHQFLSRTPDLHVRVASLGGEPVTADRLTFSNLDDLVAIDSCDVLLVPGGGGCCFEHRFALAQHDNPGKTGLETL